MDSPKPLVPKEGLFVVHLFYQLSRSGWEALSPAERSGGLDRLKQLIDDARQLPGMQVLPVALIARADLGFVLIGPDLQVVQTLEKRLGHVLGADVLLPVFTFFSMTERSEYTTTEAEYAEELKVKEGLAEGPELTAKLEAFRQRIEHYVQDRLHPKIPDWEFFAFYPMSKRRNVGQNWYALDHAERKDLMKGHATVGRKYSGRILQIITGATGLDDWEWGVTLFAHDAYEVKAIVYEMRFDTVTAQYAEFGEFYTGVCLPFEALCLRLGLSGL